MSKQNKNNRKIKNKKPITNQEAEKVVKKLDSVEKKLEKEEKQIRKKTMKGILRNHMLAMAPRRRAKGDDIYREAKAYDAVDGKYLACVFSAQDAAPCRIPSIFPSPSALFKYSNLVDFTISSAGGRSFLVVFPWNLVTGGGTPSNTPSYINLSTNVAAVPTNEYTTRIAHQMQGYMGDLNSTARYTSYRIVACRIELVCTAAVLNISGIATAALCPGLGAAVGYAGSTPASTALIQHPFGHQKDIKDITESRPLVVSYFPLDPLDQIFHNSVDPSDNVIERSPMYVVFDNIPFNLSFRATVTTVVEYIPTLQFRQWTDTQFPDDKPRTLEVMRSAVTRNPKLAVSGGLSEAMENVPESTSGDDVLTYLKKATIGLTRFTDNLGGIPKAIGAAVRSVLD